VTDHTVPNTPYDAEIKDLEASVALTPFGEFLLATSRNMQTGYLRALEDQAKRLGISSAMLETLTAHEARGGRSGFLEGLRADALALEGEREHQAALAEDAARDARAEAHPDEAEAEALWHEGRGR